MFDEGTQLFEGLIRLIESWNPELYATEKDYQEDLYDYLCDLKDNGEIREERRILRERGINRADIVVEDIVGIEVKKDLRHQPEVDRCVAQIKRMKNEYNFVIVVIVGDDNSRQHIDILKHELKEFRGNGLYGDEKLIKVIQIESVEHEEERRVEKRQDFGLGNFDIRDLI